MPIDFPASPSIGDVYTVGSRKWTWTGNGWQATPSSVGPQGIQGIQGTQGTQGTQGLQGLQGTQGTLGTTGAMNVAYTQQGTLSVVTGLTRYYFEENKTITKIRASVGTAPTGASLIVRVFENGVSIGDTTITAGSFTGTSTPNVAVGPGDYITASITQVGSTIAGTDLTVVLTVV